jgi:hypothetical protein
MWKRREKKRKEEERIGRRRLSLRMPRYPYYCIRMARSRVRLVPARPRGGGAVVVVGFRLDERLTGRPSGPPSHTAGPNTNSIANRSGAGTTSFGSPGYEYEVWKNAQVG